LREAELNLQPCPPIRTFFPELTDELSAYQVQTENTSYSLVAGRRLVGRKIGLTAKVVQQQLGVSSLDYGMLFADMCRSDRELLADHFPQPKPEAKVALVMERDLVSNSRRSLTSSTRLTMFSRRSRPSPDRRLENQASGHHR
jgi:2-keto-4-pentenoate hydratase